ncbi:unnamed protein product [Phytomonas sp. Hart1]|nr:unnamed protein product [Phytomonas sp. Hart1]|eukprot:CCW67708.1 unnamed protein product [Phytomonas sp. isolate Hart1]
MDNTDRTRLYIHRSHSAPSLLTHMLEPVKSGFLDTGAEAYACQTMSPNLRNRFSLMKSNIPSTPVVVNDHAPCQLSTNVSQNHKQDNESVNFIQWNTPVLQVNFRDWYIYNFCNLSNVRTLSRIQTICDPLEPIVKFYFVFWSISGETEFYIVSIPTFIWIGFPLAALEVASMLCVTQYLTGTLKDLCCCPRPPCPPLSMRGRHKTHSTEYGFPSTHSSNGVIFSYFIYRQLHHHIPRLKYLWLFVALLFSINVSYSRLYLGMHWIGDVIGGWLVAILCVLNHTLYLNYLEYKLVNMNNPPWWCYLLVYVVIHILAIIHATPHDPCQCYLDSLRFLGVTMGALYGFWIFKSVYGTLTARTFSGNILNFLMSYRFWLQWAVCIVMVIISKELSALLGIIVLKRVFKFLSGAYAGAFPPRVRRVYLIFALLVGYTTRGRLRRPCFTTLQNSTAMNLVNEFQTPQEQENVVMLCEISQGGDCNGDLTCISSHSNEAGTTTVVLAAREQQQQQNVGKAECSNQAERLSPNEDEGYLNEYQVWSLRTHKHWWLWEAHKYTFSYAVMGFVVVYISQVLLIKVFKIK